MNRTGSQFSFISIRKFTCSLLLVILLGSCASQKKTYKQLENKRTVFTQKKYKFVKGHPPIQRYYSKGPLFRPRK